MIISKSTNREPLDEDTREEYIDVGFNSTVTVYSNNMWDYDDDYSWAYDEYSRDGDWYSYEGHVYLTDPGGLVEIVDDLIEDRMPSEPGTYEIKGVAHICFLIDGITRYFDTDNPDGELDYTYADATYSKRDSSVDEFTVDYV